MTIEQIKQLYISSSIPENIIDACLTLASQYNMLGIFNSVAKMQTLEERENFFNMVVAPRVSAETKKRKEAEKKKYQTGMNNLISYIKTEIINHIENIIADSNGPIKSEKSYESKCMLKAFAIEYTLKIINILSQLPEEEIKKYTNISIVEHEFSNLMKQVREQLVQIAKNNDPTVRTRTGHEINELLNNVLQSHIANLIKYRSIANYGSDRIISEGYIPTISDKSQTAFAADYFLMIKDFTSPEQTTTMREIASQHNEIYQQNNKAFEQYRYKDKQANLMDYQELNARMAASHMILEFLLNNVELFRQLDTNQIEYDYIKNLLTQEEYDKLVEIAKNNSYDINQMILYHAFLKQYLKERTPKLNDKRYERINKLFEEIKQAGDISYTSSRFIEWYSKIDITTLTPEEIKELNIIDPNFIYKSLSYKDKLIYKKCQKYGIVFEYYYKISPQVFEKIIQICGDELEGRSINIGLFSNTLEETISFFALIKDMGLSIDEIPDYYYRCRVDELINAYNEFIRTNGPTRIIPQEFILNYASKATQQEFKNKEFDILNKKERDNDELMRTFSNSDANIFTRLLYLINQKYNNYDDYANHDYKKYASSINNEEIELLAKILGISLEEILKISVRYHLMQELLKEQEFQDLAIDFQRKRDMGLLDDRVILDDETTVIKQEIVATQNVMDKQIEVGIDMLFLTSEEILLSYKMCQSQIPELKIGDYLFYKTPLEVREIINLCNQNNIPFTTDLLYFDYELLQECIKEISTNISIVKQVVRARGVEFGYQDAREINQHYVEERKKRSLSIPISPELSEILEESTTVSKEQDNNPHK